MAAGRLRGESSAGVCDDWPLPGCIIRTIVNVHPLLDVSEPLADLEPRSRRTGLHAMCRGKRRRAGAGQVFRRKLFYASRLAANLYGSSAGHLPDLNHRDHDLLLGQVYLVFREARPAEARRWIGEDSLPKAGYRIKDPDAFLVDAAGDVIRVIESAGRYSPRQVESFHDHCVEHGLPYELW